jgi:putative hydroxymethylpyrimidine transport system substrate-binding protein
MRRLALAIALAASVLGLAACGEKSEPSSVADAEPFDLALDFYVNPDHAGIYTAIERGYFGAAGLDVTPRVPSDPSAPIKQVAAGRADLAISYEPEVLLAEDQNLEVIAVAALVDEPLTTLISLPAAGIAAAADLQGKTVATAGIPYQRDYLEQILAGAGLSIENVSVVDVGLNLLPAIVGGSADAILGGFQNIEGVDLTERGLSPNVVGVEELGVPSYDELVLVANRETLDENAEKIRLFISALEKGTRDAVADPAAATEAILKAGQGLDPKLTRAETDATLPLLAAAQGGKNPEPYGYMDPDEWEKFAGFFSAAGQIDGVPPVEDVLTNEFLPPVP